jgi:magnesium-transporting ATPase (P-type)
MHAQCWKQVAYRTFSFDKDLTIMGCKRYNPDPKYKTKQSLILEGEKFSYQKALSDLSGSDVRCHHDVQKNEAGAPTGESTEVALSVFAEANLTAPRPADYPRVGELTFDSVRKMMTTVHRQSDEKFLVITKGALEAVLEACDDDADENTLTAEAKKMTESGLRVLAYGYVNGGRILIIIEIIR